MQAVLALTAPWIAQSSLDSTARCSCHVSLRRSTVCLQGRQTLPADYWKEFARVPYLVITAGTLGAYLAHPFMQAGSWSLQW